MINWDRGLGSLNAETPFAKMRVVVDMPHSPDMDHVRYSASVSTRHGLILASVDDVADEPLARAWCEEVYANLLHRELTQLQEA